MASESASDLYVLALLRHVPDVDESIELDEDEDEPLLLPLPLLLPELFDPSLSLPDELPSSSSLASSSTAGDLESAYFATGLFTSCCEASWSVSPPTSMLLEAAGCFPSALSLLRFCTWPGNSRCCCEGGFPTLLPRLAVFDAPILFELDCLSIWLPFDPFRESAEPVVPPRTEAPTAPARASEPEAPRDTDVALSGDSNALARAILMRMNRASSSPSTTACYIAAADRATLHLPGDTSVAVLAASAVASDIPCP